MLVHRLCKWARRHAPPWHGDVLRTSQVLQASGLPAPVVECQSRSRCYRHFVPYRESRRSARLLLLRLTSRARWPILTVVPVRMGHPRGPMSCVYQAALHFFAALPFTQARTRWPGPSATAGEKAYSSPDTRFSE